jgi:hypothetical protein
MSAGSAASTEPLVALEAELDRLKGASEAAHKKATTAMEQDDAVAIDERLLDLEQRISEMPAQSLAGVLVKLRTCIDWFSTAARAERGPQLAMGALEDLTRLYGHPVAKPPA